MASMLYATMVTLSPELSVLCDVVAWQGDLALANSSVQSAAPTDGAEAPELAGGDDASGATSTGQVGLTETVVPWTVAIVDGCAGGIGVARMLAARTDELQMLLSTASSWKNNMPAFALPATVGQESRGLAQGGQDAD